MLRLEIVTPEKRVLDAEVDSVTVPTASGEAGILPQHAPLVSALKPGVLSYSVKGNSDKLAVSAGFVEVNNDKVAVLVGNAGTAAQNDTTAGREGSGAAGKKIDRGGGGEGQEGEVG